MTLFNITAPTVEEIALRTVAQSKMAVNSQFTQYVVAYKKQFDIFWHHPNCTPQQMAEAWGTEAGALFQASSLTRDYLLSLDPNCLSEEYKNAPTPVTLNENGTVTVG